METHERELNTLAADMREIKANIANMQNLVVKIADTMERLARVEERNSVIQETMRTQWKRIDELGVRVGTLEKSEPLQTQTSRWVMSAVWAAAGVAATMIAKSAGLL